MQSAKIRTKLNVQFKAVPYTQMHKKHNTEENYESATLNRCRACRLFIWHEIERLIKN